MTGILDGLQVLVVDDDPYINAVTKELFEFEGAICAAALSVAEALDRLDEFERPCDALLVDVHLRGDPVISGEEGLVLLRWLRTRPVFKHCAVIVMSGYVEGLPSTIPGVSAVIAKPYNADTLSALVRRSVDAMKERI